MKPSGLAVMPPPTPLAMRPSPAPRANFASATGITVLSPSTTGEPNTAAALACPPIASASSASRADMSFCAASASSSVSGAIRSAPWPVQQTKPGSAPLDPFRRRRRVIRTGATLLASRSRREETGSNGDSYRGNQMGGEGEQRGFPERPLQPRAYDQLRRRRGGSCVSFAACRRKMGGFRRRRSGGNVRGRAVELPHAVFSARGAGRRLRGQGLWRSRGRRDRRDRAPANRGDEGHATAEDRVGGRRSEQRGARSPAP